MVTNAAHNGEGYIIKLLGISLLSLLQINEVICEMILLIPWEVVPLLLEKNL